MNYLSRLENKLGFDKIRGAVEAGCSTNAARSVASDFTFMTDKYVSSKLKCKSEFMSPNYSNIEEI